MLIQGDLELTAGSPNAARGRADVMGQVGSQQFWYWVIAHYPVGTTTGGPFFVRNAPDVLSSTNYVLISWDPLAGATSYDILRTANAQIPSSTGNYLLGSTGGNSFSDQGQALTSYTLSGLPYGAPVTARVYLNNRDYANPTLEMPDSIKVAKLFFGDGSFQTAAAAPGAGGGYWLPGASGSIYFIAGNVGIGTTSPNSNLAISGASNEVGVNLVNTGTGGHSWTITAGGGSSGFGQGSLAFTDWTAGSCRVVISSAGNVGIGTTSPRATLSIQPTPNVVLDIAAGYTTRPAVGASIVSGEIHGGLGPGADGGFLRVSAGGETAGYRSYIDLSGYATTPDFEGNITFGTHSVERMRVTNTGNVGIGTTSPSVLLSTGTSIETVKIATWDTDGSGNVTGIGATATAQLTFGSYIAPNGTPQMILTPQGNVGIGTSSPSAPIHVLSGASASGGLEDVACFLAPNNTVVGSGTVIELGVGLATANAGQVRFIYQGSGSATNRLDLGFWGNASPILSCTYAGNVGIGTPNPSAILDINSATSTVNVTASAGTAQIQGQGYSGSAQAGGLGITALSARGTPSAPAALASSDYLSVISFDGYSGSGFVRAAYIACQTENVWSTSSQPACIQFATSNAERMRITSTGNVGIGTIPAYALDVAGDINSNANIRIGGGTIVVSASTHPVIRAGSGIYPVTIASYWDGTNAYGIGVASGQLTFGAQINPVSGTPQMVLTTAGNVGIGTTSPSTTLSLAGANNIRIAVADGGPTNCFGVGYVTGYLIFCAGQSAATGTGQMVLGNNGNVGIGTATPTAPLHVVGLATYASDSAAGTAGLTTGAFYKDASGGVHVKL